MIKSFFTLSLLFICFATASAQENYFVQQARLRDSIKTGQPDAHQVKLLLQLGKNFLNKAAMTQADRDSALVCYNQAFSLSTRLKSESLQSDCQLLKGKYFIEMKNLEQAKLTYRIAIIYYHQKKDDLREAEVLDEYGSDLSVDYKDMSNEKIVALTSAMKIFSHLGMKLKADDALREIAGTNIYLGKLDLAEKQLLQILSDHKTLNYRKHSQVYYLLYTISHIRNDLKMELYYALETKKNMLATGDNKYAVAYYFSLGETYQELGLFNDSFINYKLSLENVRPGYNYSYRMVEQMVIVLIAQKQASKALDFLNNYVKKHPPKDTFQENEIYAALGLCYEALGNNQLAEKAYLKVAELIEINCKKNFNERSFVYYNQMICEFYVKTKSFAKAKKYLIKLDSIPKRVTWAIKIAEIELLNFKVDSAFGRLMPAINEYQAYKKINDSIFNAVKVKQANEIQLQYETVKKDRDLMILKKQNQLSLLQVVKEKIIQRLIASCAVVLILLLVVGYWRYREKLRLNKELQLQKEEVAVKNSDLEHLLHENRWLLKEVHHRVKNNLQIVMSLLNSQSAHLQDENALNAVKESKMRVQAMSLIHQKLYGNDDVSTISMPEYIDDLVENLQASFKSGKKVHIIQEIAPFNLDVSQAVPVGLILNEAITNAMKYAFPHTDEDTLIISMTSIYPSGIKLSISDNGRGIPAEINLDKIKSFGLKLVKGLTEDLGGNVVITSNNGTELVINFEILSLQQSKWPKEKSLSGYQIV